MIPTSARDVREHTPQLPPGFAGPAPVFRLRVPTLRQRAAWRRDIAQTGARIVTDEEMFRALRECMTESEPANLASLIEVIDRAEAIAAGTIEDDEGTRHALVAIENAARGHPRYAELIAARSFRFEMTILMSFRHFVCGWTGLDVEYRERGGIVPEDVVEQVPEAFILDVGAAAMGLLSPSRADRGNSASPRPSPSDPATSPMDHGHQAAGAGSSETTSSTSTRH